MYVCVLIVSRCVVINFNVSWTSDYVYVCGYCCSEF
jgi:hypothetical protein